MDRPAAGLELDSCTDGNLLRRAYARVTPLCLDVKGQMNGFAALDIHPHRRYVIDIGGSGLTVCRLCLQQNAGGEGSQARLSRSFDP